MYKLYRGDCKLVLHHIKGIKAIISDPPYGIKVNTRRASAQRGGLWKCQDFPAIIGDQEPFDPTHLLGYPVVVLFGANYFAPRLPVSGGWVVWDKLNGLTSKREWGFNDQSDCELIWTNVGGAARLIPHRWMGCLKESERRERRVHPTQKPVALMEILINQYTKPGDLVCDPYMGSGSTGIAAVRLGRRFVGMERSREYYEIAQSRIMKELDHE
jgi:site-specific DNA-methyltransferase (adenine-specific)/modification methylase